MDKKTRVGHKVVSTVSLGVPSCFIEYQYETMVFKCNEKGEIVDCGDLECHRYTSAAAAEHGHNNVVSRLEFELSVGRN